MATDPIGIAIAINRQTAVKFADVLLEHDDLNLQLLEDQNDANPWKACGWLRGQRVVEQFRTCAALLSFVATLAAQLERVDVEETDDGIRRAEVLMR